MWISKDKLEKLINCRVAQHITEKVMPEVRALTKAERAYVCELLSSWEVEQEGKLEIIKNTNHALHSQYAVSTRTELAGIVENEEWLDGLIARINKKQIPKTI